MGMTEKMKLQRKFENEILELIDNLYEYTRSDLQGRISAIVMNTIREVKKIE